MSDDKQKPYTGAKLNPILHNLLRVTTDDFKRPNHPDFMTTAELKAFNFTGLRENKLASQFELWIVGEVVNTVSFEETMKDPFAVAKMQADYAKVKGE